jgi:hypothetical protein
MAISLRQGTRIFAMRSAVAYLRSFTHNHAAFHRYRDGERQATEVLRQVLNDMADPIARKKSFISPEITAAWTMIAPPDFVALA